MSVRTPWPVAAVQQASCSTSSAPVCLTLALSCELRPPGPTSVWSITCASCHLISIYRSFFFRVLLPSGKLDACPNAPANAQGPPHKCLAMPQIQRGGVFPVRLQPVLLSVKYSSTRQRDHMQQKEQRSTSCSFRMASCCWSRSHSRRARSSAAPVTPRASASSVAVPAASLWPLMRQSCACCSQHVPASASSPASTASCRRSARIGSCSQTIPLLLQMSLVSFCSSCQCKKPLAASSARSVSIYRK